MDEKTIGLIKELTEVFGKNFDFIVGAYSTWYLTSALGWIIFGILIIAFAFKIVRTKKGDKEPAYDEFPFWIPILKWGIVFIGALFILFNIPDLISPEGIALHRIITDIRGN